MKTTTRAQSARPRESGDPDDELDARLRGHERRMRVSPTGNCSSLISDQDDEAGFTLVEVIAAFAILAIAMSVLMSAISNGLRRSSGSEMEAAAGALAQSLLAKAGTEMALATGERDGQEARLLWRLRMSPFGDAADQQHWPVGAYLITAEIYWRDPSGERSLAVSTLRLGPKEQAR